MERLGYSRVSLFVISLERKLIYMLANYVEMQAHTRNLKLLLETPFCSWNKTSSVCAFCAITFFVIR